MKAGEILKSIPIEQAKPYYKKIAIHYAINKQYDDAELYYIKAGLPIDAVDMYTNANMWEIAHQLAMKYIPENEVYELYINRAKQFINKQQYTYAERLYLLLNEIDLAINMYKKFHIYDDMIRLVKKYKNDDILKETYQGLAHYYQKQGNLRIAEQHFIQAKDISNAIEMYKQLNLWNDCIRVAKAYGTKEIYQASIYQYAMSITNKDDYELLVKQNIHIDAIEYAMDINEFPNAFKLASYIAPDKMLEIHYEYAMSLEDIGQMEQAELEFIKANKPQEAIEMWIHQENWIKAIKVAEQYKEDSIDFIYHEQAKFYINNKQYKLADNIYYKLAKPELIVEMYKKDGLINDALRIAKIHVPSMINQLQKVSARNNKAKLHNLNNAEIEFILNQANMMENNKQYSEAIDKYLSITYMLLMKGENLQAEDLNKKRMSSNNY